MEGFFLSFQMSNRRTTLGPISQSTLNSRAGLGPPAASRVSFGGNMGGSMLMKKPIAAASRLNCGSFTFSLHRSNRIH